MEKYIKDKKRNLISFICPFIYIVFYLYIYRKKILESFWIFWQIYKVVYEKMNLILEPFFSIYLYIFLFIYIYIYIYLYICTFGASWHKSAKGLSCSAGLKVAWKRVGPKIGRPRFGPCRGRYLCMLDSYSTI